ncbi:circadian clock-controlled protein daywake-like [Drosophila obscura]|uniref:circadian clock-controlled protein daywake-like n=1 Tax=Drosophila obscura TaxID=7282 RepID=UPI000BA041CC|nr:circadian clock-controlled protein daywake-like [Drosophila obscura]
MYSIPTDPTKMRSISSTVVLSLQLITVYRCQALNISDIQRCRFGDSDCIIASMNSIIRRYPKGIPALGLKPIDVVDILDSQIWNNDQRGAVWFNFKMFDQVNYGFENTTITKVGGFDKNPTTSHIEIFGEIPSLIHKGRYTAAGKLLLIKINTTGEFISDFQNFKFSLKLKVLLEYRNNKRYLKMYELAPRVSLDRWIIWLDDFFHENTDLTILVNQVFNAHWVEFWNELEPSILSVFRSVFTRMIEDIFEKVSYDDLFLS